MRSLLGGGKHSHRKLVFSATLLAAAASIAGLASYATFTSSTSASQTDSTGTVVVALGAAGAENRLAIGASLLAAGDTIQRTVRVNNTGSLDWASATLTTTATTSSLLDTDGTNGLQMVVDKCSQAWTESGPPYTYTCGGSTSSVIASRAVIGSGLSLGALSALTAGGSDYLRVTLTLPAGAPNTLQGLSSTIQFQFDATQRAATNK